MKAIIFTDMAGYHGFGRAAGAYRIASEYRSRGDEVKVIDCFNSYTLDQLKRIIADYRTPDTEWIGFSTTFMLDREGNARRRTRADMQEKKDEQTATALPFFEEMELFSYIKELGLKVVIGGYRMNPSVSQDPDVISYYGPCEERLFSDFDFTQSQILYNEDDHIFEDEDLPIEIARGCIFKCKFCHYHLNGKKLWDFVKDPELIQKEMMSNYINFGTTGYMFSDDTYNDSPEKVEKLLEMYRKLPFDLRFSSYLRLDLMIAHPQTQDMLIESGLKSTFFGLETLNHGAGKFIGKGMDPEKIKRGLLDFRSKYPDVIVSIGMIGGLPGESLDDMEESHRFLTEEAGVHSISWSPLFINSGSDMSVNALKYGYTKDGNNQRSWTRKDGLTYMEVYDWIVDKKNKTTESPAGFTLYNRLHNIGYSDKEIRGMTWEEHGDEMLDRSEKYREIYLKKII